MLIGGGISMNNKESVIKELRKKVGLFARKIALVYKALGWKWHGSGRDKKIVPDAVDIAIVLIGMLEDLKGSDYMYVATGGLSVFIEEDAEDACCLVGKIEFKIDEEVYEDEV